MSRDFVYSNENPYRIEESDCVCRAITRALGFVDYEAVEKLLEMSAVYNRCDTLCVDCYKHLLENVFRLPVKYPDNYERVVDIAKQFPNNKIIIRIEGHLTVSDCGVIHDLWDCSQRLVDRYWIVS